LIRAHAVISILVVVFFFGVLGIFICFFAVFVCCRI
jgi:hypothetical protein